GVSVWPRKRGGEMPSIWPCLVRMILVMPPHRGAAPRAAPVRRDGSAEVMLDGRQILHVDRRRLRRVDGMRQQTQVVWRRRRGRGSGMGAERARGNGGRPGAPGLQRLEGGGGSGQMGSGAGEIGR